MCARRRTTSRNVALDFRKIDALRRERSLLVQGGRGFGYRCRKTMAVYTGVYTRVEARVRGACACTCVAAVRVACAKGY